MFVSSSTIVSGVAPAQPTAQVTAPFGEPLREGLCERWRDGQTVHMLSKTRHGPAAVTHFRSFPFLARHKRGIISGSGDQVFHAHNDSHGSLCVFELSLSKWTQWNLRCIPAVRAPDQQQHQTIRLMKNRVLFQNVHHCPQCMSSKNDRGHPLNPCFGSRSWFTKAWTSVLVLAASECKEHHFFGQWRHTPGTQVRGDAGLHRPRLSHQ